MLGPRVPVLLALLNRRPKATLPLWISVCSPITGCPCSGGSWQRGYQPSSVTAAQLSTHQSLQTRGGLVTTSRSFPLQVGMPSLTDKRPSYSLPGEECCVLPQSLRAPCPTLPAQPSLSAMETEAATRMASQHPPTPYVLRPWHLALSQLSHCFS